MYVLQIRKCERTQMVHYQTLFLRRFEKTEANTSDRRFMSIKIGRSLFDLVSKVLEAITGLDNVP